MRSSIVALLAISLTASARAAEAPAGDPPASPPAKGTDLFSNLYNPAMSVNALFLASASSLRSPPVGAEPNALEVQELELQFLANVDPYFTANLMLSLPHGGAFGLEEGYVIPAARPLGLELRVGRLKVPFGRENVTHTHALPMVDRSLVGSAVLGDGLTEDGVEVSWLTPLPWYAVVTASVLDGRNEVLFASPSSREKSGFAGIKNVFDLDDDTTLEADASYAVGHGDVEQLSQAVDGQLVLKWHPARNFRERELIVLAEAMWASHPNVVALPPAIVGPSVAGAYALVQWRLAQRWISAARVDYVAGETSGRARRASALVAFAPSEFSAVRAQLSAGQRPDVDRVVYEGLVQLNITLGAHPAHSY
jgi:hypothetical protein